MVLTRPTISTTLHRTVWLAAVGAGLALATAAPTQQTAPTTRVVVPRTPSAVRDWNTAIDDMLRTGAFRTERRALDDRVAGRTHERLGQYHNGVRVFGGELIRQMAGAEAVSVFGALAEGLDVNTRPSLTNLDARAIVARMSGVDVRSVAPAELLIVPKAAGGAVLCYSMQVWTGSGPVVYFIDAVTGQVAWQYSNLQTQAAVRRGRGVLNDEKKVSMRLLSGTYVADDQLRPPLLLTYDLRGNLERTKHVLNGLLLLGNADLAASAADPWTDGASVDAHVYHGWTYDYYLRRFGRRSLDNRNGPIIGLVHPAARDTITQASPEDVGIFYLNAFWDGLRVVYGDGLPPGFVLSSSGEHVNYFAGALDVVAHELTHGVTQYTSNLIYVGEAGALNESFSDIMGTSVEFFYEDVLGQANYLVGENISPSGVRSLSNPLSLGDPDHYSLRFLGPQDNGGIHINSTIPSHAFYLAVEGGRARTSGQMVTGVGADNRLHIEQVFYRAFTALMPSNATFTTARAATIQAARDLYGLGSSAEAALAAAWTAVGVE